MDRNYQLLFKGFNRNTMSTQDISLEHILKDKLLPLLIPPTDISDSSKLILDELRGVDNGA